MENELNEFSATCVRGAGSAADAVGLMGDGEFCAVGVERLRGARAGEGATLPGP